MACVIYKGFTMKLNSLLIQSMMSHWEWQLDLKWGFWFCVYSTQTFNRKLRIRYSNVVESWVNRRSELSHEIKVQLMHESIQWQVDGDHVYMNTPRYFDSRTEECTCFQSFLLSMLFRDEDWLIGNGLLSPWLICQSSITTLRWLRNSVFHPYHDVASARRSPILDPPCWSPSWSRCDMQPFLLGNLIATPAHIREFDVPHGYRVFILVPINSFLREESLLGVTTRV